LARFLSDAREAFLRQDFEGAARRAETVLLLCDETNQSLPESPHPAPDAVAPDVAPPEQPRRLSGAKLFVVIGAVILVSVVVVGTLFGAFVGLTANQKQQSYQSKLTVNRAEWRYESPSWSAHTARGEYYLWLNVSIENSGISSIGVSGYVFKLRWSGENAGVTGSAAWSSFDLASGRNATLTVGFSSQGLKTPEKVDFQYSPFANGHVQASIPAPPGPATEVLLGTSSAEWKDVDILGLPPSENDRFLWLTVAMTNQWDESATINLFTFKAEGQDGSTYSTSQRQGPDEISAGGTGTVELVFEVPNTWTPKALHYDMTLGPWADVEIPTPSSP
jgi:uncharacterized protein DUF4352